ncbi:hypothetical protein [Janthinobacterium sp. B9-8]|uniref:hypothetical protein n=1 Tax=Janthinobacterium sp. B9-8 TaxID=1236179 RepID=UPI00061D2A36|nr:hypothetical protein [Janthinobacterium sp. B9-8]AMC36811.1 hypothetical protein VN23_20565 [Janthinobacterium sp. B9-8]
MNQLSQLSGTPLNLHPTKITIKIIARFLIKIKNKKSGYLHKKKITKLKKKFKNKTHHLNKIIKILKTKQPMLFIYPR